MPQYVVVLVYGQHACQVDLLHAAVEGMTTSLPNMHHMAPVEVNQLCQLPQLLAHPVTGAEPASLSCLLNL